MMQKKTAVGLKIPVIVAVKDIEIVQVLYHSQAQAVAHALKLDGQARDRHASDGFPVRQAGIDVAVGGQDRRRDKQRLKAVGYLKGLVGGPAHIREERFNGP